MRSGFQDSVVLITSKEPKSNKTTIGTGFIIHQDQSNTYLLTCAHVIRDVGGVDSVIADSTTARVIALGEPDGFDLAVLRVEEVWDKPILKLSTSVEQGNSFIVYGFYLYDKSPTLELIEGILGKQRIVTGKQKVSDLEEKNSRTEVWQLKLKDKENYLRPGYSGAPVINKNNGKVFAVVTHLDNQGETGSAISIEAVEKIWLQMPLALYKKGKLQQEKEKLLAQKSVVTAEIERIETNRAFIGEQIGKNSRFREAAQWLNNDKKPLSEIAGRYALENDSKLKEIIGDIDPKKIDRFYREIERHLELIHGSLITEKYDLLHIPRLRRSVPAVTAYQMALKRIEHMVPENLSGREDLIKRLEYLSNRLSLFNPL
jgi:hypothetical protein